MGRGWRKNGVWSESVDGAVGDLEASDFSGMASPQGQKHVDNGSPLFVFLVHLAAGHADVVTGYSQILYQLARVMLPGRKAASNLTGSLPFILQGLAANGLADTDMVLMALATIRAETANAAPVSEGISQYNSTLSARHSASGTHPFDLYDNRKQLGNRGYPDGPDFKGRGFVQLTGRTNYEKLSKELNFPLTQRPEMANDPRIAGLVLGRFLRDHESRIRAALRRGDLKDARRAVNGGTNGLDDFAAAMRDGRNFIQREINEEASRVSAQVAGH